MAQQIINNGESGLIVRNKLNDNFTELYTGKDSVTVANFAALPAPATVPGQRYWCLASQGVYLINRKPAGAYYSDGVAWTWLGDNPTTADQLGFVPTGALTSTNVQAAIVEATDRAKQTGTQTASTISDFDSASRAQTEAELVAGTNITITPSGSGATRQLTIEASGGGGSVTSVTGTAPIASSGGTTPAISISAATPSAAGSMSAADKAKLDNITYTVLGADVTNNTTTPANVGLAFAPASSSTYLVEVFLNVQTAVTTTGIQIGLSAGASTAIVAATIFVQVPSSTVGSDLVRLSNFVSGGSVIAPGTAFTTLNVSPAFIRSLITTTTGASGNIDVVFNSEVGGSLVTVGAGSTMRITKVA